MATANKLTAKFTKSKETKNTVQFAEEGDDPIVATLYVKKGALEKLGDPEQLEVTIEASS